MEGAILVGLAALYALVNGLNDGGSLTGTAITRGRLRPITVLAVLTAAIVLVPLVFGAPVAETLAARLVDFGGQGGQRALMIAVVVALTVTGVLAWARLPTSLTLATIGAIVGVGLGSGLAVDDTEVLRVVLLAIGAPLMGGLVGVALMALARVSAVARLGRAGGRLRTVTSVLVALAYAANDGQKMIAVGAIAIGAGPAAVRRPGVLLLTALAVVFAVGSVVGMRRTGHTLGTGVLSARPTHLVASELSAAGVVAATGWLGAPVSMTQALAGSLAGSGVSESVRRVRWRLASRLLMAWVVTFPAALLLAAGLAGPMMGGT